MSYYKTNSKAVRAALNQHTADMAELWKAADAIGEAFGGKPYLLTNSTGTRFGGVRFSPSKSRDVWTAPDVNRGQRPRQRPASAAAKDAHAEASANWKRLAPSYEASFNPIFTALGTSWQDTLFCGIGWFEHKGYLYVSTKAKLGAEVQEILGSEHEAALAAYNKAKP